MPTIIDLSHPLDPATPPFPGDPPVEITIQATIPLEHPVGVPGAMNVSRIATGVHVGTHMDAPFHFYRTGQTIDQIPLERCMGAAVLVDLAPKEARAAITPDELMPFRQAIRQTRRVILYTGWAARWQQPDYFTAFPVIGADTAQFLLECDVDLVGIDTPSVDTHPYPVHFALLGNNVLIVENLTNLDRIQQTQFQFIAFPLKITARDASPVRAVAIIDQD
jgi:arylformamidase